MEGKNQGIQLFSNLLNQIADTKAELINPNDFAGRRDTAYEVLLNDFEAYLFEDDVYHLDKYRELRERLGVLVELERPPRPLGTPP